MRSSTPSSRRTRTGRAREGGPGAGRARRMTRQLAVNVGACALLLIQYLLGMVVNVYVVLPGRHPGAGANDYASGAAAGLGWVVADGPAWAAAHAAFGMALAAAALAAVALAWRRGGTGQSGFGRRRPRDHRGGVQRGQLRQLRACLQLNDHGRALGTGAGLLHRRSDTRHAGVVSTHTVHRASLQRNHNSRCSPRLDDYVPRGGIHVAHQAGPDHHHHGGGSGSTGSRARRQPRRGRRRDIARCTGVIDDGEDKFG